jgi:hypothetical protein
MTAIQQIIPARRQGFKGSQQWPHRQALARLDKVDSIINLNKRCANQCIDQQDGEHKPIVCFVHNHHIVSPPNVFDDVRMIDMHPQPNEPTRQN